MDEHRRLRDRALFDLAIDSKLRGCDVVKLKIGDVVAGGTIRNRTKVIQQKTGKPVQFELGKDVREACWPGSPAEVAQWGIFFRAVSTATAI